MLGATALAACTGLPGDGQARDGLHFRNATSLSPFAEYLFDAGISYRDFTRTARTPDQLQALLVDHGATEVFARIGTRRGFRRELGDHSIQRGRDRARIARNLGIPFNPELGLFAYYGDVTQQPPPDFDDYPRLRSPKPWHEMGVDDMVPILAGYGAAVAEEILGTGVTVNFWDIGNEVEFGAAGVAVPSLVRQRLGWTYRAPDAIDPAIGRTDFAALLRMPETERVHWLSAHLWPHLGRMFAAVAGGIRTIDPAARFSTHMSGVSAFSAPMVTGFFRAMDAAGFRVDQPGLSYYPSSTAEPGRRFERFRQVSEEAHAALGRRLFVAEFAYPVGPFRFGGDDWSHAVNPYPISRAGQADFLRDLARWGAATGHLAGIRPWAPEIVVPAWLAMSLFDLDGTVATARPGLDSIARGLELAEA